MELQDFRDALDDLGLNYYEGGASIVIKTCPSCGSEKYKVHLRAQLENGLLFGRCYAGSCQTNYSSFKFLLMSGMDHAQVMKVHGMDREDSLRKLTPQPEVERPEKEAEIEPEVIDNDISKFFKVSDWPDHPASKYAIRRGVNPDWPFVMIDHASCAVVFVVYKGAEVIGYQRRFLYPNAPEFKTKTSIGFKKTEHIMVFDNPGKDVLVCEGPFTAVAAWRFGYTGVCTFGSGVSDKQLDQILELANKSGVNIGVAFDDDKAGHKGTTRIRSAMFWNGKKTFKVIPSTGNDLNDALMAGGTALVKTEENEYNPAVPELVGFF